MFVLQECSICFEDFDVERNPHSIPCGHIFCFPCLESLASSSASCPNCRTSFDVDSFRKVVCAHQEDGSKAPNESEAEALMWQAIQSSVEAPKDYDQRKSIVKHNTPQAVREAGLSVNLLIALDVMHMLVKVEQQNHSLKDRLDTSQAVEASLCDKISRLEAQLSATNGGSSANSPEMQLLLSEVRSLRSSVQLIKEDTTNISRHFTNNPASLAQLRTQPPSTPIQLDMPIPEQTSYVNRPGVLRKHSSHNSPATPTLSPGAGANSDRPPQYIQTQIQAPSTQEYFPHHLRTSSTPGPPQMPRQLLSPPGTPAATTGAKLLGPSSPMLRRGTVGTLGVAPSILFPEPQSPRTPKSDTIMFPVPQTGGSSMKPQPSLTNPFRPGSQSKTPERKPNTINALYTYSSASSTELSFTEGQVLHLFPDSDLSSGKDWVWLRTERGVAGYAPRSYLRIE